MAPGIDPAVDRDVAFAAVGELQRFGHRHLRGGRQEAPDAVARPERSQHDGPCDERDETCDKEDEGDHRGDDSAGKRKGP